MAALGWIFLGLIACVIGVAVWYAYVLSKAFTY